MTLIGDPTLILKNPQATEEHISQVTSDKLRLEVYPNPFTQKTVIELALPTRLRNVGVQYTEPLQIYDLGGRLVKSLPIPNSSIGSCGQSPITKITWDTKDLTSGIYFVKLVIGDHVLTKKLVSMK